MNLFRFLDYVIQTFRGDAVVEIKVAMFREIKNLSVTINAI